jgi:hypothetical protein
VTERTSGPGCAGDSDPRSGGFSLRRNPLSFLAAALCAAGLASPLGVAPLPASAADSVDLTGCLAPGASPGDRRTFRTSAGSNLTEKVLQVSTWKKKDGWTSTVEAKLASNTPTVRETFVKPGKLLFLGDLTIGDLSIEVGDPDGWFPLDAVPGRAYTSVVRGKALRGGVKVGSAKVSGAWQVVGFEPLTTPARSYSDTVHIAAARTISVKEKGGPRTTQESDVELWCVDGVGVVAASYAFRFYQDGALVGEVNDLDSWLLSATVDGARVN